MNLPNALTLLRLAMIPFVVGFLFAEGVVHHVLISLVLFLIAMATDVIDGVIARRFDLITKFGVFFDPLADKLLINLMLFSLAMLGVIPFWLAAILFARDALSSEFKSFAALQKVYVSVAPLAGKLKAFLETVGIVLALLSLMAPGTYLTGVSPSILRDVAYICLLFALLVGLVGLGRLLRKHLKNILSVTTKF